MKAGLLCHQAGVHESRFIRAFRERGVETEFIGFDELSSEENLAANKLTDLDFVFGGPLHLGHAITPLLKTIPFVAVSYAYDLLYEAVIRPESAASATRMLDMSQGLLVDCEVVAEAAKKKFGYSKPILCRAWGLECKNPSIEQITTASRYDSMMLPLGATVVSVRNFTLLHSVMDVVYGYGDAASRNPSLHMIMAGDGPLRAQVIAAVHELGLSEHVTFLGNIPELEMVELIRKADLYVSASLVDGTSISLLQALEAGVPVLLSNVGGNAEWANRVDGADLFEAGDWKKLGALISEKISIRRYDRSSVLEKYANWPANADEIVRFCTSLAC